MVIHHAIHDNCANVEVFCCCTQRIHTHSTTSRTQRQHSNMSTTPNKTKAAKGAHRVNICFTNRSQHAQYKRNASRKKFRSFSAYIHYLLRKDMIAQSAEAVA